MGKKHCHLLAELVNMIVILYKNSAVLQLTEESSKTEQECYQPLFSIPEDYVDESSEDEIDLPE